jgi:hypothetical protein
LKTLEIGTNKDQKVKKTISSIPNGKIILHLNIVLKNFDIMNVTGGNEDQTLKDKILEHF